MVEAKAHFLYLNIYDKPSIKETFVEIIYSMKIGCHRTISPDVMVKPIPYL